jgi:hypothetical protein
MRQKRSSEEGDPGRQETSHSKDRLTELRYRALIWNHFNMLTPFALLGTLAACHHSAA